MSEINEHITEILDQTLSLARIHQDDLKIGELIQRNETAMMLMLHLYGASKAMVDEGSFTDETNDRFRDLMSLTDATHTALIEMVNRLNSV